MALAAGHCLTQAMYSSDIMRAYRVGYGSIVSRKGRDRHGIGRIDKRLYKPISQQSMQASIAGFEWDDGNRDKCRTHDVLPAAIEAALRGPLGVFPDPAHSGSEERFKAIGRTDEGRHVLIVFTLRRRGNATFIRPISARYMHRKEIAHYEKAVAEAGERQGR